MHGLTLGPGAYIRLRLSRLSGGRGSSLLVNDTTSASQRSNSYFKISIPCAEQGVRLAHARFESNVATFGGALGVSEHRTSNSFFDVTNSTFIGNSAKSKGGAIHVSGYHSGASFKDGCVFRSNQAAGSGTTAGTGGGGAVSVEENAVIRIQDAEATGNAATGVASGGFLSAYFAGDTLLERVTVRNSNTEDGGGGAISIVSANIILYAVHMTPAISAGVGACSPVLSRALLKGGSTMTNNSVRPEIDGDYRAGFGGHIRASESRIEIGVVGSLPPFHVVDAVEPLFPKDVFLVNNISQSNTLTNGTALSGGGIFCSSAQLPSLGVHSTRPL